MNWISIPIGNILGMLTRLHGESVINAAYAIASNPNVTVSELEKLLSVIEREISYYDKQEGECDE